MQMLTEQPWKWVNLRLSFQPVQFRNIFEVNDRMVKIIGRSKSNWSMVKLTSIVCVCFFTQHLPIQTVDIHKIYWLVKIWFCFSKSWNEFLNIAKPTEWIGKHQFYISFNRFNRIFPIITFFSIVFILGALDNRKKKRKEVELFCPHNKCIIQMSTNH